MRLLHIEQFCFCDCDPYVKYANFLGYSFLSPNIFFCKMQCLFSNKKAITNDILSEFLRFFFIFSNIRYFVDHKKNYRNSACSKSASARESPLVSEWLAELSVYIFIAKKFHLFSTFNFPEIFLSFIAKKNIRFVRYHYKYVCLFFHRARRFGDETLITRRD